MIINNGESGALRLLVVRYGVNKARARKTPPTRLNLSRAKSLHEAIQGS